LHKNIAIFNESSFKSQPKSIFTSLDRNISLSLVIIFYGEP
jgi:hypothetical protein